MGHAPAQSCGLASTGGRPGSSTAQAGLVMQPGKRGPALTRPCSSRTGSRTAGCSRPMPVGQRLGAGQPITRLLPTTAATGSTARVHGGGRFHSCRWNSRARARRSRALARRRPGGQQGRGVFRLRVGGAVGYVPALRPRGLAPARQVTRLWTAPGPRRWDGRVWTWVRGQVVVRPRGSRASWGGAAAVTPPSASAASGRFWGRGKAAGHAAYAAQARGLGGRRGRRPAWDGSSPCWRGGRCRAWVRDHTSAVQVVIEEAGEWPPSAPMAQRPGVRVCACDHTAFGQHGWQPVLRMWQGGQGTRLRRARVRGL